MPIALSPVPEPVPSARRAPPGHSSLATTSPARVLGALEHLRIVGWADCVVDPLGYDPRSRYVETFWLGVLGPTSTWLLRRLASGLEQHPSGFELDVDDMARALGLGGRSSRHSPFRRALVRCVTFGMARPHGPGALAVRRRLPPLSRRHLQRLPASLRAEHDRWLAAARRGPVFDELQRRARHLALGLAEAGLDADAMELQLVRWHVHPAIACQATEWAMAYRRATPPASRL